MAAGTAAADPPADAGRAQPADIEGRWRDSRRDLTLDITRCGDQICGQIVDNDQKCGARALVATWRPGPVEEARDDVAGGTLDLPTRGGHYKVRLLLHRNAATAMPSLQILGGANEEPSLYRRMIPLVLHLARIGDAACHPRATS